MIGSLLFSGQTENPTFGLKVLREVSVISLLLGLAVFGVVGIFAHPLRAMFAGLAAFGLAGAAEVFQAHRKAEIAERLDELNVPEHTLETTGWIKGLDAKFGIWTPKLSKEFVHRGLVFRVIEPEELPIPLMVAGPFCPACKESLVPEPLVLFPGLFRVRYLCACGFQKRLAQTPRDLYREAKHISRVPK